MVVAIFNSNEDVISLLQTLIQQAGFVTVTGHIDETRQGYDMPAIVAVTLLASRRGNDLTRSYDYDKRIMPPDGE